MTANPVNATNSAPAAKEAIRLQVTEALLSGAYADLLPLRTGRLCDLPRQLAGGSDDSKGLLQDLLAACITRVCLMVRQMNTTLTMVLERAIPQGVAIALLRACQRTTAPGGLDATRSMPDTGNPQAFPPTLAQAATLIPLYTRRGRRLPWFMVAILEIQKLSPSARV